MDIMTERHEVATRVQKALAQRPEIFGEFRTGGREPALHIRSVHHLYKLVNGQPLVRPAWYFDIGVQGEGITDVTTHLADLAQWITGDGEPFDYERDVELLLARQWPTEVPRDLFSRITGLDDFPAAVRDNVIGGALAYLCNAEVAYRLRHIPVRIESLWQLAIPEGGGDTHYAIARGTKADLVIEQGPGTHFVPELSVRPLAGDQHYARLLAATVASLQGKFPGLGFEPVGAAFRVIIPLALRTTHEEHFAAVLDEFLGYLDGNPPARALGPDLVSKYTLLARAAEMSHRRP
jgi:predicted dehydrogenase